jgi:arylsulfatase A-like enzyme
VAVKPEWKLDGVDLLPHLTGKTAAAPHDALYWRYGPQWAVRQGDWKLVRYDQAAEGRSGPSPVRLYDLRDDIGEATDLASKYPDRVTALRAAWVKWDAENVAPLWGGGKAAGD